VSADGRHWTVAATVTGRTSGTRDALTFPPVRARYAGIRITAATSGAPSMMEGPILEELTVET
jgi:hypothetical protein